MIDKELINRVNHIARTQVIKWYIHVDPEDVAQEVFTYLLEWPNELAYLKVMEDPDKKIRGLCGQVLSDLVEKENATPFYSTDEVRSYLRDGILSDPSPFPEMIQLDLCDAFETLRVRHDRYLDVLIGKYVDDIDPDNRMVLTRSVDALTQEMNRAHSRKEFQYDDGPGSRTVMSNSSSQALTSNQWNG
jgi:hypothetical protein